MNSLDYVFDITLCGKTLPISNSEQASFVKGLYGFTFDFLFENEWNLYTVIAYLNDLQLKNDTRLYIEFCEKFIRCLYHYNNDMQAYNELTQKFKQSCKLLCESNELFYESVHSFFVFEVSQYLV